MGIITKEDRDFDTLLADKRHKELAVSLRQILDAINETRGKDVSQALDKQSEAIKKFLDAFDIPTPLVNIDQQIVVASVQKLGADILAGLAEIKTALDNKPNWEFTVKRAHNGVIDKVTAKQIK